MLQNTHKVALVTGAARRIGAETARILHENGFNVVLHYHTSQKEAEILCAELNELRAHSAMIAQANLANVNELAPLIEAAVKVWGRLDVVINNASQFYKTELGTITETAWDDLINTNLKAPLFLSQAAAPYLTAHHGCIINIADIHGEKPMRDYPVYCVSKAGLIMLTKALAQALGQSSVRVNAVSPGPIAWPEHENELSVDKKMKLIERTALKCEGHLRDVAKAVLYFVRDADYVTGHVLAVDAGRSLFM